MGKVSYCSSCKGRLWQLKTTLAANLDRLSDIDAEWVILDYSCPDKVSEFLLSHAPSVKAMKEGKLKLYKLEQDLEFSMPLAKNLAHLMGEGDILFNLDIDNFIGNSFEVLKTMKSNQYCHLDTGFANNGQGGRIGVYKDVFCDVGGYDLDYVGYGYDDIDFISRLKKLEMEIVLETVETKPIPNTPQQSDKYLIDGIKHRDACKRNRLLHLEKLQNLNPNVNPKGLNIYKGEAIHPVRVMPY